MQQVLHLTSTGDVLDAAVASGATEDHTDYIRALLARADDAAAGQPRASATGAVTLTERASARRLIEMLPDCAEGFLVAVLRYFDGSVERSLDALLEGNLPSQLADLPRTLAKPPPERTPPRDAAGPGPPKSGRYETATKRRALQEEHKVLADVTAPGRRAPKAVLDAAASDGDGMVNSMPVGTRVALASLCAARSRIRIPQESLLGCRPRQAPFLAMSCQSPARALPRGCLTLSLVHARPSCQVR